MKISYRRIKKAYQKGADGRKLLPVDHRVIKIGEARQAARTKKAFQQATAMMTLSMGKFQVATIASMPTRNQNDKTRKALAMVQAVTDTAYAFLYALTGVRTAPPPEVTDAIEKLKEAIHEVPENASNGMAIVRERGVEVIDFNPVKSEYLKGVLEFAKSDDLERAKLLHGKWTPCPDIPAGAPFTECLPELPRLDPTRIANNRYMIRHFNRPQTKL